MKLLPILLILSILVTPIVYKILQTHYYPFQLFRDPKRDAIPKAMIQQILNKFGGKKVSELRNLKIIENKITNVKTFFIEAFILDTTTHSKWNNPEAVFLFIFSYDNGKIKYISHKRRNTWDIGKLIPEDTDALLQMNPALPNKSREDIGVPQFRTCEKEYCEDVRKCQYTAGNSVMCNDTIIKTKNILPPIFNVQSNNDHVSNERKSQMRPVKSKYSCEFMLPEYSSIRHPYEVSPFSCKLRYEQDFNPNRAPIVEGVQNEMVGPLKAANYLQYNAKK